MKKLMCLLLVSFFLCGVGTADDKVLERPDEFESPTMVEFPGKKAGAITLTNGWNLIAMPVIPLKPYTVKKFVEEVEKPFVWTFQEKGGWGMPPLKEWIVHTIAVYKNKRFMKIYPNKYSQYNLVPGEAYFVYARYYGPEPDLHGWYPKKTITIPGRKASVSLNLEREWNGVSWMRGRRHGGIKPPYPLPVPRPPYSDQMDIMEGDGGCAPHIPTEEMSVRINTLGQLLRELNAQGVKAKAIIFWSARKQEWIVFDLPRPQRRGFDEKIIRPDEGFFLLCEENGLYVPGLKKHRYPEVMYGYTGRVRGIGWYAFGPPPPYEFMLDVKMFWGDILHLPLRSANADIREKLQAARSEGDNIYTVISEKISMLNFNGLPDGAKGVPVEVLVVYDVEPPSYRLMHDAEKSCEE